MHGNFNDVGMWWPNEEGFHLFEHAFLCAQRPRFLRVANGIIAQHHQGLRRLLGRMMAMYFDPRTAESYDSQTSNCAVM